MWPCQSPADVATPAAANASAPDAVMAPGLPDAARPLAGGIFVAPSPCAGGIRPPSKLYTAKYSGAKLDDVAQRAAFAPVDSQSPAAHGLAGTQPFGFSGFRDNGTRRRVSSVDSIFAVEQQRRRSDPDPLRVFDEFSVLTQRRERSADPDEYRQERSRSRTSPQQDRIPVVVSTPAQSLPIVGDIHDEEMQDVLGNEDKENTPPADFSAQLDDAFGIASFENEGFSALRAWQGRTFGSDAVTERAALNDMMLEIPPEDDEQDYSVIDSSSDSEDMESENLAEQLEKRIHENAGNKYDFEIFCDPPA